MTRPYSTLILGAPLGQHRPSAHAGVSSSRILKLISRKVIFEVFQPVWKTYLNSTHRQTERYTDGRTTYCGITALCVASRGKNVKQRVWFNWNGAGNGQLAFSMTSRSLQITPYSIMLLF